MRRFLSFRFASLFFACLAPCNLLAQSAPAQVATAAQQFGQQDDISVLRIVRDASVTVQIDPEPAMAAG